MTESQIFMQSAIYQAMMDLKKDIETLKTHQKFSDQQIHKCHKLSQKTYSQMNDKFQQVVKLTTSSYIELTSQNNLIKQQNIIHTTLTKNNDDLVLKINQENLRLNSIFNEQKEYIDKLIRGNQAVINQELNAVCKKQEGVIQKQIQEYGRQNRAMEEQRVRIQLAFEAVASFQGRNRELEEKLFRQKQEIQQYIKDATIKNKELVVNLIQNQSKRAIQQHKVAQEKIQKTLSKFLQQKSQCLQQLQQQSTKTQNTLTSILNKCQKLKNDCQSIHLQSESTLSQQKSLKQSIEYQHSQLKSQQQTLMSKLSSLQQQQDKQRRSIYNDMTKYQQYGNRLDMLEKRQRDAGGDVEGVRKEIGGLKGKIGEVEKFVKGKFQQGFQN